MSTDKAVFKNYSGVGETNKELYSYSQSVKFGSTIRLSGQGGWDDKGDVPADTKEQIDNAFTNILKCLKLYGIEDFDKIASIRSYHLNVDETFEIFVAKFREIMPNHQPVWTCIQVPKLALPGMQVEVECDVYDP